MTSRWTVPQDSLFRRCFHSPWLFFTLWFLTLKLAFWWDVNYFIDGWRILAESGFYIGLLALLSFHQGMRTGFLSSSVWAAKT